MKKILYLFLTIGLLSSCDSYLDVNNDPNYPTEVPNSLLIPSAENFISARLGEDIFNFGGFFAQYWDQAVEANQYNRLAEYNLVSSMFSRSYSQLYAGALADLEVIRTQASESEAWGDYLVATVLRAYTFQIMVDLMSETPYSEAFQGNDNSQPAWDEGPDVYAGLLAELDNSLGKITGVSTVSADSADFLLAGDLDKWVTFGNAMKLKLLMRSSDSLDNSAAIMALINSGACNLTEDIKMDIYTNAESKRNPWFECNWSTSTDALGTVNNIASYPIISYLNATSDPRLAVLYNPSKNASVYKGLIPGSKTVVTSAKTDDYSLPIMTATTPVYFFTVAELQFFIAEAQLKYGTATAAQTAYEAAINANFVLHGLSGGAAFAATSVVDWDNAATDSAKLELIGMQKWVALCMVNHFEAWAEARRLDIPSFSTKTATEIANNVNVYTPGNLIIPMVDYLGNGTGILKRIPYPETAVNLNKNTPTQPVLTKEVWWDQK
jgi:hypothetical protein